MPPVATKVTKIGIMGPWGENLGDAAIQQAMISHIRKHFPGAEIYGFTHSPADTERLLGIRSFPIGRVVEQSGGGRKGPFTRLAERLSGSSNASLRALSRWLARGPVEWRLILDAYRNVRGLDYFIISGGGQLDDYWGGAWSHPYTLLKFSALARLHRARLMFVSVGAGPIDYKLSKLFLKAALSLAEHRSYRDESSKRLLEQIGFRRGDPVYPDLAQSLDLDAYWDAAARIPRSDRTLVGVGPMAYFDPRAWPQKDQAVYMGYMKKLAQFAAWLIEGGHDVLLFTGEVDHDRDVIDDMRALLEHEGIARDDSRVIDLPIATVDDLMPQLVATDLVVASRFHGVLLAQLVNKPVLALSYHKKIDVLMDDMGQSAYCLQIDDFSVEALKERFTAMKANCQAIKSYTAGRTRQYREALDEQYRRIFAAR